MRFGWGDHKLTLHIQRSLGSLSVPNGVDHLARVVAQVGHVRGVDGQRAVLADPGAVAQVCDGRDGIAILVPLEEGVPGLGHALKVRLLTLHGRLVHRRNSD